jgi:hypothetical protein
VKIRLRTTATCEQGCGLLDECRTGDPLVGPRRTPDWTRAAEVEAAGRRHGQQAGHAVLTRAEPA